MNPITERDWGQTGLDLIVLLREIAGIEQRPVVTAAIPGLYERDLQTTLLSNVDRPEHYIPVMRSLTVVNQSALPPRGEVQISTRYDEPGAILFELAARKSSGEADVEWQAAMQRWRDG